MPRKQTCLIGQGKYLRLDTLDQLLPISAGQIGATDGAGKDQVAAEADACA